MQLKSMKVNQEEAGARKEEREREREGKNSKKRQDSPKRIDESEEHEQGSTTVANLNEGKTNGGRVSQVEALFIDDF